MGRGARAARDRVVAVVSVPHDRQTGEPMPELVSIAAFHDGHINVHLNLHAATVSELEQAASELHAIAEWIAAGKRFR